MDGETPTPQIIEARCILCGACLEACEPGALSAGECAVYLAHPERCGGCCVCEEVCPEGAISCSFTITWGAPRETPPSGG